MAEDVEMEGADGMDSATQAQPFTLGTQEMDEK